VNLPAADFVGAFDGMSPLHHTGFLSNMDFLTAADKADYNAPFWNAFGKFNEMRRFGLTWREAGQIAMESLYSVSIEGALRFIENQNMLRRHKAGLRGKALYIILNAPNESFSIAAGKSEFILKDIDQWPVP
jgi:hypothetical protein